MEESGSIEIENIMELRESTSNLLTQSNNGENLSSLLSKLEIAADSDEREKFHNEILALLDWKEGGDRVSITSFRRIIFDSLNVDASFMYKRVFNAVDVEKKGYLTPHQLISLIATLLNGPLEAQVELALRIYGKPSKGKLIEPVASSSSFTISKTDAVESIVESLQLSSPRARHTLTTNTREKAYKVGEDLVLLIFPKLDANKDGVISYEELLKACENDYSLVQVFGQFLPKERSAFSISRPNTPVSACRAIERPLTSTNLVTFKEINYLKYSPKLKALWGKVTSNTGDNSGKSERLEPIALAVQNASKQKSSKKRTRKLKS